MATLDHANRPIAADETPETVIKVWRVKPSDGEHDSYVIRCRKDMLDFVRDEMEAMLDQCEGERDQLASITVVLVEMTRAEYDAVQED